MYKNILLTILILLFLNACSFLNEKSVYIPIKSNPSGAIIYLSGTKIGTTPANIRLDPSSNYRLTLEKEGYGSSILSLETWYSARGGRGLDSFRCSLDAIGSMLVIPAIAFYSVHCRDFKKKEYIVNITPSLGSQFIGKEKLNNQNHKMPNFKKSQNNSNFQQNNSYLENFRGYNNYPYSDNYYQ